MASLALTATASVWQRLHAYLTGFAEALETDCFTYHDLRIASLERRIGVLEGAATRVDAPAIGAHAARPRS